MYLFIIPLFMYTAIHTAATIQKSRSDEADGHLCHALAGLAALYVLLAVSL